MRSFVILLCTVFATQQTYSTTIQVPTDHSTIQGGIDAVSFGDTVLVAPDTYYETIILKNGVKLLGAGDGTTIINGGDAGTVVTAAGVGSETVIDGFTIRDGRVTVSDWGLGGGFSITGGSELIISNNIITSNSAIRGGGITIDGSSPTIQDNKIAGNNGNIGGGLFISGSTSSPSIINNTISYNNGGLSGGGIYNQDTSPGTVTITGNLIMRNYAPLTLSEGGGIFIRASVVLLTNNTIAHNTATYGDGMFLKSSQIGHVNVTKCILYNSSDNVYWDDGFGPTYSCCYTSLSNPPLFCDLNGDEFELASNSPCAPANSSCGELIGARPVGCDMRGLLGIASTDPARNECNAPIDSDISVTLNLWDDPVDETTISDSTIIVYSKLTGKQSGSVSYNSPTQTITFGPTNDFKSGEPLSVHLDDNIESNAGYGLNDHAWDFITATTPNIGEFQTPDTYPLSVFPIMSIPADIDGDGDLDLVSINGASADPIIITSLNDGSGHFTPDTTYELYGTLQGLCTGDFNGDGAIDLAVTKSTDYEVIALLNDGYGKFEAQSACSVDDYPIQIIAADFDNDGKMDLATTCALANTVSILPGNGDGSFASQKHCGVGEWSVDLVAGDFDGDNDRDLAVANYTTRTITILRHSSNCSFTYDTCYGLGALDRPAAVCAADFDGDGDIDIAAADYTENDAFILLNDGAGEFSHGGTCATDTGPEAICAADIDGDGDIDLTTGNNGIVGGTDSTVSVLLNNGNGVFEHSRDVTVGNHPNSVAWADLNNDGCLDLITANDKSDNMTILLNSANPACGDANGDGAINIGDPVYIINYVFKSGPASDPLCVSDA
ncbi:MAG: hypothetical protein GY841_07285, partial [FCB group bacterium]|nr:hypothetical protein [FCB group bacterium]